MTADMMSEEEEGDNGSSYIRHQPVYRSNAFNTFIEKLDRRLNTQSSKHPRLERRIGSPREKPIPTQCKRWMLNNEEEPEADCAVTDSSTDSDN